MSADSSRVTIALSLYPYLLRKGYKLTRHKQDAEDLVQEAYLYFWTRLPTFSFEDDEKEIRYFLFRTLQRRWIDEVRRRERRIKEALMRFEESEEGYIAEPEDPAPSPHELHCHTHEFREVMAALKKELALLPADRREAVVLAIIEEWKYADISKRVNVPTGTIKAWVSRFRERLAA